MRDSGNILAAGLVLALVCVGCASNAAKIGPVTTAPANTIRTDQTTGTVAVDLEKLALKVQDLLKVNFDALVKATAEIKAKVSGLEINTAKTDTVGKDQIKDSGAQATDHSKAITIAGNGWPILTLNIALLLVVGAVAAVYVWRRAQMPKRTLVKLLRSIEEADARQESAGDVKQRFSRRISDPKSKAFVEKLLDDRVRKVK